jgi:BRCT domain type II-containing protein
MKEFEDFAKAVSLGMKALAKIIETAADQLEEQVQTQSRQKPRKEAKKSPQQAKTDVNAESPVDTTVAAGSDSDAAADKSDAPTQAKKAPEAKTRVRKARKSSRKTARKTSPGAKKITDTEKVLRCIQAAPDGIHLDAMKEDTGFAKKKLHNIVHRLKGAGKIQNVSKGVYKAE